MIGKGSSISHTKASMRYGWNQEKDADVVFRQHLTGQNPSEITREFKLIQEQNYNCKKNTFSFVLSPTIEDGHKLKNKDLNSIANSFIKEMKLESRQAIAFVHNDKKHKHIHLYVNRIDFNGKAYNDSFIGKKTQLKAEIVAKKLDLTTVKDIQQLKKEQTKSIRKEIKEIHETCLKQNKPRTFQEYIDGMKQKDVQITPSINKSNQLQGFRYEYKGNSFKGSSVHRTMSINNLSDRIDFNKDFQKAIANNSPIKLANKSALLSPNLALKITKKIITKTLKHTLSSGI